jgi:hypothetical protein
MAKHLFQKGYTPWNKGTHGLIKHDLIGIKNPFYGKKHSEESKKKMSVAKLGRMPSNIEQLKHPTFEQKEKSRLAHIGFKPTINTRKKMSEAHKGEKSYLWRGGITEKNHAIRASLEYRIWREAVFARDNWTCVECGERGGKLNADHIKPFSLFPELRFAIDNGRTLCLACHRNTETWGRRIELWQTVN